ncbi:MAG: hypothetical protein AAFX93_00035 [Verrucomicrobiota bacterium]
MIKSESKNFLAMAARRERQARACRAAYEETGLRADLRCALRSETIAQRLRRMAQLGSKQTVG